jgi:hypothetical protein
MTESVKKLMKKFSIIIKNYNRLTINNKFFINLNNMIIKLNNIIRDKSNTIYLKDIEITELKKINKSNIDIIDLKDIEITELKKINISNRNIIDLKNIEINKVIDANIFNKNIIGLKDICINNLNKKILELNKIKMENSKLLASNYDILFKNYTEIINTIDVNIVDDSNILFEYIIYLETFSNGTNIVTNIVKIIVFKNLNYVCYEGVQRTINTDYCEIIFNDYPKYCYIKQDNSVKITNQIYIEKLKKLTGYIFNININGTKDFEAFIELIVCILNEKRNMKLGFIENIDILYSLII